MKHYDYTLSEQYFRDYHLNNYHINNLISKWKDNLERYNIPKEYWKDVSVYLEKNFNDNLIEQKFGDFTEMVFKITMEIFKNIDLSKVKFTNKKTEKVQFSFNLPHNISSLESNIDTKRILFETIINEYIKYIIKIINETSEILIHTLIDYLYIDYNNISFYGKKYYILGYFEGVNSRLAKIKNIKKRLNERI
ncbi:MAG: hypothetical protein WDA02_09960 [Saccharofermentanales bacterium]